MNNEWGFPSALRRTLLESMDGSKERVRRAVIDAVGLATEIFRLLLNKTNTKMRNNNF